MKSKLCAVYFCALVQQSKWDQKQTTFRLNSYILYYLLLIFMHRCFNWWDSLAKLAKYFKVSKNHFYCYPWLFLVANNHMPKNIPFPMIPSSSHVFLGTAFDKSPSGKIKNLLCVLVAASAGKHNFGDALSNTITLHRVKSLYSRGEFEAVK